jgi:hypothetical protein
MTFKGRNVRGEINNWFHCFAYGFGLELTLGKQKVIYMTKTRVVPQREQIFLSLENTISECYVEI